MTRTIALWLMLACLIGALGWSAGFFWFVHDATHPRTNEEHLPCDGIVALTGGELRVDTALTLFADGRGRLLLISGVGPHVTLEHLLALQPAALTPEQKARITLGRRATTTIGNAHETAAWAKNHHLSRLLLVTAGYHIRRATLEMHRVAPELALIPYPVVPKSLQTPFAGRTPLLLLREYTKFLGAELGSLTGVPDGREGLNAT